MYSAYANAFRYPAIGLAEQLEAEACSLSDPYTRVSLLAFLELIRQLSLGEWEELYTRTWDLDPLVAPYIGFHIWGEDYRRGNFLARLQTAYRSSGMGVDSELPDHLVSILRYLNQTVEPMIDLVEVLQPALAKMSAVLRQKDPFNPYLGLIESLETNTHSLQPIYE